MPWKFVRNKLESLRDFLPLSRIEDYFAVFGEAMAKSVEIVRTRKGVPPFLKWPGGKRWLTNDIFAIAPTKFNRYYEPFLGGAALFFGIQAWPATLSDVNEELINTYAQVRDNPEDVIDRLKSLVIDKKNFMRIRQSAPRKEITRAVRFIYLNRTAYNGIYRVNQNGKFNVPFGCKKGTKICDEDAIRRASRSLKNRTLLSQDFERSISAAQSNDLVYADPPYTVKHNNNGFKRYNEVIFSWADQVRLAACCIEASKRGVHVIVSNALHQPILDLYPGFKVKIVSRVSRISGNIEGRVETSEAIIYSC